MDSELARRVKQPDQIIGVRRFNLGNYVIFTRDYMTKGDYVSVGIPQKMFCPKGHRGKVIEIEPTSESVRVDLAIGRNGINDAPWVEGENLDYLQHFEPDEFDIAWFNHDYAAARKLYEGFDGDDGDGGYGHTWW